MTEYTDKVSKNLLPLSRALTLKQAFKEWHVTGDIIDHEKPDEHCQLCEHEGLRWHFGIENTLTGHHLWVGSQCILRFEIPMYSAGRELSKAETKRALTQLLADFRKKACLNALRDLAAREQNDILTNAVSYFERKGNLSPKLASVVLWRLKANNIDHDPHWFKVALRREQHRADLAALPIGRVHRLWPALTPSQRKLAQELGHKPPPPPVKLY